MGTRELRIRHWLWTDNNISHKILDINAWPGDNESGIISSDDKPILTNSDTNLHIYIYMMKILIRNLKKELFFLKF